ncbi:MAG: NUDIX domain-containing protein [Bacteroidales bacterium]|nr:NUDIX domain-containing protein [Bacteroidales bacterium]
MGQRYRVFLNEKVIQISEIINTAELHSSEEFHDFVSGNELESAYKRFRDDSNCNQLTIFSGLNHEKAIDAFNTLFQPITAAGGIIRNASGQILLIHRLGKWDLPKGKAETGESIQDTAIREVQEETGLMEIEMLRQLPSTYHIYTDRHGKEILKTTYWFEMMYSGNAKPIPETVEDISIADWFSPEEVQARLTETYASLRELLEFYLTEV